MSIILVCCPFVSILKMSEEVGRIENCFVSQEIAENAVGELWLITCRCHRNGEGGSGCRIDPMSVAKKPFPYVSNCKCAKSKEARNHLA